MPDAVRPPSDEDRMSVTIPLIRPEWPAPLRVAAACTTRGGGCGVAPYDALNLATHVGDDPLAVEENRRLLALELGLPAEPVWLDQVHGATVVDAARTARGVKADAAYASQPGVVCAVLTADCLPVLFCDEAGTEVAAAHAGWRGLAGALPRVLPALRRRRVLPPSMMAGVRELAR